MPHDIDLAEFSSFRSSVSIGSWSPVAVLPDVSVLPSSNSHGHTNSHGECSLNIKHTQQPQEGGSIVNFLDREEDE